MKVRCASTLNKHLAVDTFLRFRSLEVYSSVVFQEFWRPGIHDCLAINMTTYHLRREDGVRL